jgi:hypothetical protein
LHGIKLPGINLRVGSPFYNWPAADERGGVRFESIASVSRCPRYVRSSPESGGIADIGGRLEGAISGSGGPWIVREYFDETPNFVAGTLCVRAKCFSD